MNSRTLDDYERFNVISKMSSQSRQALISHSKLLGVDSGHELAFNLYAEEKYTECDQCFLKTDEATISSEGYRIWADAVDELKQSARAQKLYDKSLLLDESNDMAHMNYSDLLERTGQSGVVEYAKRAIEIDPCQPHCEGYAKYLSRTGGPKAVNHEEIQQLHALHPKSAQLTILLSVSLARSGASDYMIPLTQFANSASSNSIRAEFFAVSAGQFLSPVASHYDIFQRLLFEALDLGFPESKVVGMYGRPVLDVIAKWRED